jgi:hypothetical protein
MNTTDNTSGVGPQKTTSEAQLAAAPLLGVSRSALERALGALEYQILSVRESSYIQDAGLVGSLLREGLEHAESAKDEIKRALLA